MSNGPFYFGVWTGTKAGHYMFGVDGRMLSRAERSVLPWREGEIDCAMQPSADKDDSYNPNRDETQGHAAIHHKDGWTALCMWDRSEDLRGGCNSNFFFEGTFSFDQMVEMSKNSFQKVWDRFKFPVVLVDDPASRP